MALGASETNNLKIIILSIFGIFFIAEDSLHIHKTQVDKIFRIRGHAYLLNVCCQYK